MTEAASLTIGRMVLELRRSEAERVTRVAERDLPAALARVLGPRFAGPGVIHLPRLEVTLSLDPHDGEAALARAWAEAFAEAAAAALAAPGAARALVFADPPARLAAFVGALLAGSAWSEPTWCPFAGLKPLPLSVALRTSLAETPVEGRAALTRLAPAERRRLWSALEPEDAERLCTALHGRPTARGAALSPALSARAEAWRRTAPTPALRSPAHAVLAFLAETPGGGTDSAVGTGGRRTLEALLTAPATPSPTGSAARPAGGPSRRSRRPPQTEADPIRTALGIAPPELRSPSSAAIAPDAPVEAARRTPFGGAVLLWPHLLAIPAAAVGTDDPTGLRREALARALGEPDARRLADDPALAPLWTPEPPRETDPDAALRAWILAESAGSTAWARLPDLAIERTASGFWLTLAAPEDAPAEATPPSLSATLDRPRPARAAPPGDGMAPLSAAPPGDRAPPLTPLRTAAPGDSTGTPAPLPIDPPPGDRPDRLATLRADAAALGATAGDRVALLAQSALRRLARRLPGFADASVAFLRSEVLSQPALVAVEGDSVTAGLGPAPLAILLNLTGLSRQRHRLVSGATLRLFPMEGAG